MYNSLSLLIGETIQKTFGLSTEITLVVPERSEHGDLSTNVALQLSKALNRSPREIAEKLVDVLENVDGIAKAEVAGPGFLNLTFTEDFRFQQTIRAWEACEPQQTRDERPVIVEYSQPNIAKPLGIHHIISTCVGQSIANLYEHLGYNTLKINHLGDWGTQFGKLSVAAKRWGDGRPTKDLSIDDLLDLYVRFHEEAEKDASLDDEARIAFKNLEAGDEWMRGFWQDVVDVTMKAINTLYERLHVSFDHVHGESFYEDKMATIIEEGKRKGVIVTGEGGALVVQYSEESNIPTAVVLKADGATIYLTRDLATIRYRVDQFNPQSLLYVVDVSQELYFRQVFGAVNQLAWDLPHLEHVIIGRMSFTDRSMSTRKGNILRLEHVLDEAVRRADALIEEKSSDVTGDERDDLAEMVGVGALVYGMLSQNRRQNMVFTWDKALTFDGNSGPYLQYTHARARSILRKAGVDTPTTPSSVTDLAPEEIALMKQMSLFPSVLEDARREAMPHKLAHYLYELCQAYNSLYNSLPILTAAEPARELRLALTGLSADILKKGAELLTLRVPDRM